MSTPRGARLQQERAGSPWRTVSEARPRASLRSRPSAKGDTVQRLFLAPAAGHSTPGAGAALPGAQNSAGASRSGGKGWLPRHGQCRAAHGLPGRAAARTRLQCVCSARAGAALAVNGAGASLDGAAAIEQRRAQAALLQTHKSMLRNVHRTVTVSRRCTAACCAVGVRRSARSCHCSERPASRSCRAPPPAHRCVAHAAQRLCILDAGAAAANGVAICVRAAPSSACLKPAPRSNSASGLPAGAIDGRDDRQQPTTSAPRSERRNGCFCARRRRTLRPLSSGA